MGPGIAIALAAIFGFFALYIGITFVQVWLASRHDGAKAADAIVVLGAAQYDGRPSPVLTARLDHALDLWKQGLAPIIVVTGGKRPGDRFTEATASANYLLERGVPDDKILREVQGHELVGVARRGGAHPARTRPLRGDLGERPVPRAPHRWHRATSSGSPRTCRRRRTSGISSGSELKHMVKETGAVALGRIIGYRRLLRLEG